MSLKNEKHIYVKPHECHRKGFNDQEYKVPVSVMKMLGEKRKNEVKRRKRIKGR